MTTQSQSKQTMTNLTAALLAGVNKHLASTTPILLAGHPYTPAEVTAKLQTLIKLRVDVVAARGDMRSKLAAEKAQSSALVVFRNALVNYVRAVYGTTPDILADFGLSAKVRLPQTVEVKAAANAKRSATRAARHTMGSKQKKGIKGDVTGVVVTPVTSARAPAAPSTPSASTGAPPLPTPSPVSTSPIPSSTPASSAAVGPHAP